MKAKHAIYLFQHAGNFHKHNFSNNAKLYKFDSIPDVWKLLFGEGKLGKEVCFAKRLSLTHVKQAAGLKDRK